MIRVRRPPPTRHLTKPERAELASEQTAANGYTKSDARIRTAWKNFRDRNAGRATLRALQTVFHNKCAFCERVNARAIDHFYPKERYPKRMFKWSNFILCCADCNQLKGSKFPFRDRQPVFIDPTREEPLDFFVWDFRSGAIEGVAINSNQCRRAHVTRDELQLDAGPLREERRVQFNRVLQLLTDVVNENPIRPETHRRLQEELLPDRPYLGIIRFLFSQQNTFSPIVDEARKKLPEIDTWVAVWL